MHRRHHRLVLNKSKVPSRYRNLRLYRYSYPFRDENLKKEVINVLDVQLSDTMRAQIPRTIKSILTPLQLALYKSSIILGSTSEFTFATILALRPSFACLISRSIISSVFFLSHKGARISLFQCDGSENPEIILKNAPEEE